MSLLFVEIFLCFAICLILFRCCGRILVLQQQQQQQQQGTGDGLDDLRQFRERLSQARGGERSRVSASSPGIVSESALAARKELIHRNLFFRQINREESVKELSRLLAISRGGDGVTIDEEGDEELGRRRGHVASVEVNESSSNTAGKLSEESYDEVKGNALPDAKINAPSPHTAPAPSAPPLPTVEDALSAETPTSDVTTAVSRLWSSLSRRQRSDISSNDDTAAHPHQHQQQHHQADNERISRISIHHNNSHQLSSSTSSHHLNKIECSICLEQYCPNDVIAWAKEGGGCDAPCNPSACTTLSPYNTGCDHIFHRECLVAWLLQDHDECPLCRRRVIHADANVRFAGWEER